MTLSPLQMRELFHLLFLRALLRSVRLETLALKGGANLRFFFGSVRYSEDMDLDVSGLPVHALQERVMKVLESAPLRDTLQTFGVADLRLPDMARAKQTPTVQRFRIGLLTTAGLDLATKIEFSGHGLDEGILTETVSAAILAAYRLPPVILPHYGAGTAASQKIRALIGRAQPQPRDVFDLYLLSSQPGLLDRDLTQGISPRRLRRARDAIFSLEYEQYRDTVVNFLGSEEKDAYDSPQIWDEIRQRVLLLIEVDGSNAG